MSPDSRDIRENVYFNELEFTAFKACCDEIGDHVVLLGTVNHQAEPGMTPAETIIFAFDET